MSMRKSDWIDSHSEMLSEWESLTSVFSLIHKTLSQTA